MRGFRSQSGATLRIRALKQIGFGSGPDPCYGGSVTCHGEPVRIPSPFRCFGDFEAYDPLTWGASINQPPVVYTVCIRSFLCFFCCWLIGCFNSFWIRTSKLSPLNGSILQVTPAITKSFFCTRTTSPSHPVFSTKKPPGTQDKRLHDRATPPTGLDKLQDWLKARFGCSPVPSL